MPDQPHQLEVGLGVVRSGVGGDIGTGAAGDRQHPQALLGEGGHGEARLVAGQADATRQHAVGRALDHQGRRGQHRFAPTIGIEREPAQHRFDLDRRRRRNR